MPHGQLVHSGDVSIDGRQWTWVHVNVWTTETRSGHLDADDLPDVGCVVFADPADPEVRIRSRVLPQLRDLTRDRLVRLFRTAKERTFRDGTGRLWIARTYPSLSVEDGGDGVADGGPAAGNGGPAEGSGAPSTLLLFRSGGRNPWGSVWIEIPEGVAVAGLDEAALRGLLDRAIRERARTRGSGRAGGGARRSRRRRERTRSDPTLTWLGFAAEPSPVHDAGPA